MNKQVKVFFWTKKTWGCLEKNPQDTSIDRWLLSILLRTCFFGCHATILFAYEIWELWRFLKRDFGTPPFLGAEALRRYLLAGKVEKLEIWRVQEVYEFRGLELKKKKKPPSHCFFLGWGCTSFLFCRWIFLLWLFFFWVGSPMGWGS